MKARSETPAAGSAHPYSTSRLLTRFMTKDPAKTGVAGSRAGMTQGNAPMWSS